MQTTTFALRRFIVENFLFGREDPPLGEDDSLLGRGIVDSTGVLELVAFIERTFGVDVLDHEIVPANLDSLASLTRFVEGKRRQRPVPG
ncbi:MAG TPA: acyl carrier protein [Vicinamibacterales bacterium]|nr:acyl carrier protein [Vicinamibacterales bacterium]